MACEWQLREENQLPLNWKENPIRIRPILGIIKANFWLLIKGNRQPHILKKSAAKRYWRESSRKKKKKRYYHFTIKVILTYHVIVCQKVHFTIKSLRRYQFTTISLRTLKIYWCLVDVIRASKTFPAVRVKLSVNLINKLSFCHQVFRGIIILLLTLLWHIMLKLQRGKIVF